MRRRAILEPDAPSPIRIAVVGLGYWGPNLARVVAALPSAQLAALCDANRAALADVGARYPGVPQIQSFNEVLADRSIDAVALATPVSTHHPLASAALAAGKHVFVEKPLAESISSAQSLVECARRAGLVLMPGHTFLYSPPVVKIKELIDSGELGEVYFIATSRVNLGLHQPDVSVVWDLAPHDFSILRYWLGESPTEVAAFSRACLVPGTPMLPSSTFGTEPERLPTWSSRGSHRASCGGRRSWARARWSSTTTPATNPFGFSTRV